MTKNEQQKLVADVLTSLQTHLSLALIWSVFCSEYVPSRDVCVLCRKFEFLLSMCWVLSLSLSSSVLEWSRWRGNQQSSGLMRLRVEWTAAVWMASMWPCARAPPSPPPSQPFLWPVHRLPSVADPHQNWHPVQRPTSWASWPWWSLLHIATLLFCANPVKSPFSNTDNT